MEQSQITIQKVFNGWIVITPYETMQPGVFDYEKSFVKAARIMKGEDDVMDKIKAEKEDEVEQEKKSQLVAMPNVNVFKTFEEVLDFLTFKYS